MLQSGGWGTLSLVSFISAKTTDRSTIILRPVCSARTYEGVVRASDICHI